MKHKTGRPINRFLRTRCFILSFLSTMIVLGILGTPLLAASDAPPAEMLQPYEPDYADTIRLLCAIRDSESGDYVRFYLLALQPFDARLYLAPLPPQLVVAAGDRQNSLAGFAAYGGAALCAEAITQSYRLNIDRTVWLTTLQLRDWVNRLNGVEITLRRDIRCTDPDGGTERIYRQGTRVLDGAEFVDLLTRAQYETQLEAHLDSARLLVGWINQKLAPRADAASNPMTEWIGYLTTNITYADYLSRADALDHIAMQTPAIELLPIGGSFSYGGRRFVLSQDAVELLQQHFGSITGGRWTSEPA